jgi:hypothetical protein
MFLFWEYLFQIFGILSLQCVTPIQSHSHLASISWYTEPTALWGSFIDDEPWPWSPPYLWVRDTREWGPLPLVRGAFFFLYNRGTETGDPARLPAQIAGRWGLI